MGIKRLALSLIIVLMLVLTACSHGTALPLATPPPSAWPTVWTGLSTDPNESGTSDHRDVADTNGDGYALYYASDSQYLYLRMESVTTPGWPSTSPSGQARYKWWFDTVGTDLYVSGTLAYKAEFQLMLEDRTDPHNVDGSRDRLGELTLIDDLANIGFTSRWNQGNSGAYITGTPNSGGPSSFWKRALGTGTAGVGGPQGVMASDIGYRINNAATGGNFVDMYISWAALGNPSSLCLIWATDNHDPNLDQAPNLDAPTSTLCLSICVPPQAAFNATPTSGCAPLTVYFTDQSTGDITGRNWTFGDGETNTLQNPSHQYTSAGIYSVTLNVTTACGWDTETKTNYITVYAGPTANAGDDVSLCVGSSVEIGGSPTGSNGTGPYIYSWTPATELDNSAIANPFASAGGSYTVRVTDANGCWDEDSVVVTENPTPIADAGIDKSISCGGSVQIGGSPTGSNGTGNYTYSWTPVGGLNSTTIANPTASAGGNYTVRVTDDNGCWDEDSVVVTVSNNTLTADAGPDWEICPGGSVVIGGNASGGTSPYTYNWTPATGLSDPTIANPSAAPGSTTIYSVLVTDSGNCTAIDHVHVTVYDTPSCGVSASPGDHVCEGTTVTLWEHGGDALNWSWSTGVFTQSIEVTSNGTYSVNITDTHGCESSCQISVTFYDGPTANAGADKSFCAGGSVQIGGVPTGGTLPYSYSWTPSVGLNDTTIANPTASAAGNYTVRVTDPNGCWDEDSVVVTENANPLAEAGADKVILPGDSVEIGGSPTGSGGTPDYTYNWTPATGLNATNIANPTAFPAVNTTYTVTVTDFKGCTDSDDVTVTVIVTESCCICGFVYRADTLEPLAGWQVILEKETSSWDVVGTNTTDANGKYCFCGRGAGNYRVSEVVQPGWNQVYPWSPNEYLVTLPEGCCDPESEDGSFLNFENQQAGPSTVGWEASPIDRLAVLAPWIALFAVIGAGASLLALRRRRT